MVQLYGCVTEFREFFSENISSEDHEHFRKTQKSQLCSMSQISIFKVFSSYFWLECIFVFSFFFHLKFSNFVIDS